MAEELIEPENTMQAEFDWRAKNCVDKASKIIHKPDTENIKQFVELGAATDNIEITNKN